MMKTHPNVVQFLVQVIAERFFVVATNRAADILAVS